LFGLLAIELALVMSRKTDVILAAAFFVVGVIFVLRSFYDMRIKADD
jgi:hypothetical protein